MYLTPHVLKIGFEMPCQEQRQGHGFGDLSSSHRNMPRRCQVTGSIQLTERIAVPQRRGFEAMIENVNYSIA